MPSYFLAVLISPSYLYSFMHGAAVEDEWCAKQNIFLHRLSLSIHSCYLICLPSPILFTVFASILAEITLILSSFCVGYWTKGVHCCFWILNATMQPPRCSGTVLLWITGKWLRGSKANCCVYYTWSSGFQSRSFNYRSLLWGWFDEKETKWKQGTLWTWLQSCFVELADHIFWFRNNY